MICLDLSDDTRLHAKVRCNSRLATWVDKLDVRVFSEALLNVVYTRVKYSSCTDCCLVFIRICMLPQVLSPHCVCAYVACCSRDDTSLPLRRRAACNLQVASLMQSNRDWAIVYIALTCAPAVYGPPVWSYLTSVV